MPTKPLDRLLFAQGELCFFCRKPLPKADASVEHLVASTNGGSNGDENCVVCCKAMNALLGSMSLKEKIQVVLNQKGQFECPNGVQKSFSKASNVDTSPKAVLDKISLIVANLQQRGIAKPKTVKALASTIHALLPNKITPQELPSILQELESRGIVTLDGTKVSYPK